ncbi:hypothetical protein U6G28_09810 [Actinomycetaceae bacterium MB13-C1-2]|nr:hypothetical protein U6G28_09810 [Actinomycetaceae bacterium MB13-C1-2]
MTTSSVASEKNGYRKFVGWVLTIIGIVMIVAGTSAWFAVGGQIKSQEMTVPGDATSNAGKAVSGPITAWSMQETIQMHADHATDGVSYAELGNVVNEAKEQYGEDSEEAAEAQALRNTQMNASFLRASLFTSILAYGVSLLVVGTGVSILLAGTVFLQRRKEDVVKVEIANPIE